MKEKYFDILNKKEKIIKVDRGSEAWLTAVKLQCLVYTQRCPVARRPINAAAGKQCFSCVTGLLEMRAPEEVMKLHGKWSERTLRDPLKQERVGSRYLELNGFKITSLIFKRRRPREGSWRKEPVYGNEYFVHSALRSFNLLANMSEGENPSWEALYVFFETSCSLVGACISFSRLSVFYDCRRA